jgi:hypothetical protein
MRLFKKRPELKDVSLQMTSMIDIVFLLVIFFMCTVQISKLELDPDVVLPVAYSGSPEGGSGRLVVNVGRGGELRVMAASYTLDCRGGRPAPGARRRHGAGRPGPRRRRRALPARRRGDDRLPEGRGLEAVLRGVSRGESGGRAAAMT